MGLLADPSALDRKGATHLRVLTDDQRRDRQRAALDAQSAKARQELDKVLNPDKAERESYEGISEAEADELIENQDDEWEEHLSWLNEDDDNESESS
jgi:hypothetical protein